MVHGNDCWQVRYDEANGLVDLRAVQADVLELANFFSRLANNYVVVKARPAPLQSPMDEVVCTA